MLTKVMSLGVVGPFALDIRFSDRSGGVHDCAGLVAEAGPMIAPLRQPDYFARVFLEFGSPTWPNGFDIDPEWLRREMLTKGELRPNFAAE